MASANLIPVDAGFGAGSGTLDTATNLVWLDLSQSGAFSYNRLVNTELQLAGQFFGFQLASPGQVGELVTDSGILSLIGPPAFAEFGNLTALFHF